MPLQLGGAAGGALKTWLNLPFAGATGGISGAFLPVTPQMLGYFAMVLLS